MASRSERTQALWLRPEYREQIQATRLKRKQEFHDSLFQKECESCKMMFKVLPCREKTQRYCNKKCRVDARTGTPNLKNRGKTPSSRAGSGISGTYKNELFRSLYELSFRLFLEHEKISFEYESIKIKLEDGTHYIPDFVSHTKKMIWEVKYQKALLQEKIQKKIQAGQEYANSIGYDFNVITEETMKMISFDEVAALIKQELVTLHEKKNGGIRYKQMLNTLKNG